MPTLATLLLLATTLCDPAIRDGDELFATARIAPADTTTYVHIADPPAMRRAVGDRPLGAWLASVTGELSFPTRFEALAKRLEISELELFETAFAGGATLVARDHASGTDWVIVTPMSDEDSSDLCRRARSRTRLGRQSGMVIDELVEPGLLLARGNGVVAAAPDGREQLFAEVLRRIAEERRQRGVAPRAPTLADTEGGFAGAELGTGSISFLRRHARPMGGWSAAIGHIEGDELVIRYRSHFEASPFTRPVSRIAVRLDSLDAFETDFLAAFIEPADTGRSQLETFLEATTGRGFLSREIRAHLGPRRIIVIGEHDGRLRREPVDVLQPTVAICLELDDEIEEHRLDAEMLSLVRAGAKIAGRGDEVPASHLFEPGQPRHATVALTEETLGGFFPLADQVSLNWAVDRVAAGRFLVIASDPDHLAQTRAALREVPGGDGPTGIIANAGTADGGRLGRHIASWGDHPERFSDDPNFRRSIALVADLAASGDRIRWKLRRPCADDVELEVKVLLQPSPSQGP